MRPHNHANGAIPTQRASKPGSRAPAIDYPGCRAQGGTYTTATREHEVYDAGEAAGLDAIVRGIPLIAVDDALLATQRPLSTALRTRHGGRL